MYERQISQDLHFHVCDRDEWTLRMVVGMQEPVLFAESIFYNIAFGLRRGEEDATLAQVRSRSGLPVRRQILIT